MRTQAVGWIAAALVPCLVFSELRAESPPLAPEIARAYDDLLRRIESLSGGSDAELDSISTEVAVLAGKIEVLDAQRAGDLWLHLARQLSVEIHRPREAENACAKAVALARRRGAKPLLARALHARASELNALGQMPDACSTLAEAVKVLAALPGRRAQEAAARGDHGAALANVGRLEEASRELKRALRLHIDHDGRREEIVEVLSRLGRVLDALDRDTDAKRCFDRAVAISEQIGDVTAVGRLCFHRGLSFIEKERWTDARAELEKACAFAAKANDQETLTSARFRIGQVLTHVGEPAQALRVLDQVLEDHERLGNHDAATIARRERGWALFELGEFQRALEDIDAALEIHRRRGQALEAAALSINRSTVLSALGRQEEALDEVSRAAQVFEGAGLARETASAYFNQSGIYLNQMRFAEALASLERARRLYDELEMDEAKVEAEVNRAIVLGHLGRHGEALSGLASAVPYYEQTRNEQKLAFVTLQAANFFAQMGRYEESLAAADEVAAWVEEEGTEEYRAWLANNRGNALRGLGRSADAVRELERALASSRKIGDDVNIRRALANLASALVDAGRHDEAARGFDEAERLAEAAKDLPNLGLTLENRAASLHSRGKPRDALREFGRAASVYAHVLGAEVQALGGESSAAFREHVRSTLRGSLHALRDLKDASSEDLVITYQTAQVFHGLGMSELLAERGARAGRDVPDDLRREHSDLLAALRRAHAGVAGLAERGPAGLREAAERKAARDTARGEAVRLEADLEKLEERIRLRNRAYAAVVYPRAASAKEVREAIQEGVALLELVDDGKMVTAFVVTRSSLEVVLVGKSDEVAADVDRAAAALAGAPRMASPAEEGAAGGAKIRESVSEAGAKATLRALGERVLDPVLARLPASTKLLLIAPDGSLCRVPFEALLIGDPAEKSSPRDWVFLVKRFPVAYVHSGTSFREEVLAGKDVVREGPRRFVAFGHPHYGALGAAPAVPSASDPKRSGYAPLPGTGLEVLRIARLFAEGAELEDLSSAAAAMRKSGDTAAREVSGKRFTVLLGGEATEAALKSRPEVKDAWALHLACHGRADLDAPALSHLALATVGEEDGLVTLRELRDLGMRADLLVLSACETASGKLRPFEGLSGLSRAALGAGARSVLSTLWQVDDDAARNLMEGFYRHWLEGGRSKAEALALAKREGIEKGTPLRTWSAYILWSSGE